MPHGGAAVLDAVAAWPPPRYSLESPVDLQVFVTTIVNLSYFKIKIGRY